MPNTSLLTLRTGVRSEMKIDRLGKIWDNAEVNDAIDMAIQEIEAKGNYRFPGNQVDVNFNSIANQQEYTIEDVIPGYQGINLVKYNDQTLYPTTFEELKRSYREFISGTPTHYYLYGDKIGFHPYPNSIKGIDVTYNRFVTSPVDDTELSPYMKAFDKAIKLYASYTLLAQPADAKNIGRANTKLARFRLEIAKLFNAYLLPDRENIVYKTSYRSTTAHRVRFGRVTNPNHL